MTIIIRKEGGEPQKISESKFEDEGKLQSYIYNVSDSIPLYEIKEDVKLLILAREFPTSSGPVDAIAVDQDGEIYLVETKLYKNPDKRLVVAQVLDYGAAIRADYDFSNFIRILDQKVSQKFSSLQDRLKDYFGINESEASTLIENLKQNIQKGNFKFVVLMNKLHEQLKKLISFINQNSQFAIFAVELQYYKYENYEITIPKLYGAEVQKSYSISTPSARKRWDEISFFEHVKNLNQRYYDNIKNLYDFSKNIGNISWGTGSSTGSFNVIVSRISNRSLYSVYSDGRLTLNFGWLNEDDRMERFREEFKNNLIDIGFSLPEDYREKYVRINPEFWMDNVESFEKAVNLSINKTPE